MQKQIKTYSRDKELSLYICAYLIMNAINSTAIMGFGFTGTRMTMLRILIQAVLIFFLIHAFNHMLIKDIMKYIYSEIICVSALTYSVVLGEATVSGISDMATTMMIVCVPLAVSAYLIADKKILYEYLLRSSIPILFILILGVFLGGDINYNIHFSYAILLLILLHLNEFISERRLFFCLLVVVELALLFIYGSRGALVCVVIYIPLKVISLKIDTANDTIMKSAIILATFLVFVLGYYFISNNSDLILQQLVKRGISSRTAYLLTNGQFVEHDSGRSAIWKSARDLIKQAPFVGWGISAGNKIIGNYPHQFFLDLWLSFGCVTGTLAAILLIYPYRKVFLYKKYNYSDLEVLRIFSCFFISLQFSSTVFTNYYFFIALGLALSVKKSNLNCNLDK